MEKSEREVALIKELIQIKNSNPEIFLKIPESLQKEVSEIISTLEEKSNVKTTKDTDHVDKLQKLVDFKKEGFLTEEEFQAAKKELLGIE